MSITPVGFGDYAVASYRYLRLAIVVMMSALLVSVLIERTRATCWEGSISAYYYTPVHAVFLSALVSVGVSLIVVRGNSEWDNVLMNLAGMLAPVVAFVPTAASARSCTRSPIKAFPDTYLRNNIVALAIGGVLSVGLAYAIARRRSGSRHTTNSGVFARTKAGFGSIPQSSMVGLLVAAAVIVGLLAWYILFRASFLTHAHSYTAIAMFGAVGIVVLRDSQDARDPYGVLYKLTAGFMAAAFVTVVAAQRIDGKWRHGVLWLEILETLPFAAFWALQTFEHWHTGIALKSSPRA